MLPPAPSDAVLRPLPIDTLIVPAALDGRAGTNRATGAHAQIAARNDLDAVRAWLARFVDTPTTFQNYRKEAERLLLWALIGCGKPLSSLTHEDLLVYRQFLLAPAPAELWCANGGRKHPRGDPRWRPFYGPLSAASQRQAMVILNVMFSWLVQAGYLAGNPLALSRQRQRRPAPRVTRHLGAPLWQSVKDAIAAMPRDDARACMHADRARWLFTLLYLGGLRISEAADTTMGRFFCRRDATGRERWWLDVTGKGGRQRLVPATDEMMAELARYRRAHGLAALPTDGEDTPLVLPVGRTRRPLTRAALHRIVKQVFALAAQRLRAQGEAGAQQACVLEQASAHWLRHSAGSHMADGRVDLRLVRDNLGHASLTTTSQYLHADDDWRHRETEEKHRIGW
ncbi:tyrosine-type recombinase/integrase [Burkholderia pseudomultivorans]|uniref:Phage integrase family protein n=1 Tax=Burkholderia cenocepacia TaxID=95486 RepID=A0AAN0VQP7_9BURK|nr:tyrosine-type recombinase/integrase [Burkholderia pseudomultivorans]AIO36481.1 phage integrase family protein [Burkholderia cenocepacia]KVC25229.1 integrase [Burkholderia pseudomultivorans]KVC27504.1 integrase [Burkholderia pseudomultivorans]KVC37120.1 integrase [Burkholderia pseudomultivorans]KVG64976.1 integrase [Burkholderia pseudomultivorans]